MKLGLGKVFNSVADRMPAIRRQKSAESAAVRSHSMSTSPVAETPRWQLFAEVIPFARAFKYALQALSSGEAAVTIMRLKLENEKLEQQVYMDAPTQLYNKKLFNMQLAKLIEISRRHDRPLSLLMLDVDHFKSVNDTHGHDIGDIVLKQIAGILQRSTRKGDFVARWGGEEFAIILPETNNKGAMVAAEKIRMAVEKETKETKDSIPVTISVGVARLRKDDEAGQLIRSADQALLKAKEGGRNRVVDADQEDAAA